MYYIFGIVFSLLVSKANAKALNQQFHLHAQLWPKSCIWAYHGQWTSPTCVGAQHHTENGSYIQSYIFPWVMGNTWTTNHCSKDRVLDIGGSVIATLLSSTPVGKTNGQTTNHWTKVWCVWIGSFINKYIMCSLSDGLSLVCCDKTVKIQFVLLSSPPLPLPLVALEASWCPWKLCMHFHTISWSHGQHTYCIFGKSLAWRPAVLRDTVYSQI
jgi:hypothetical protein